MAGLSPEKCVPAKADHRQITACGCSRLRGSLVRAEAFFSRSPTYADSDVPQLAALIPDKNVLDAKPIPAFNVPRPQYFMCAQKPALLLLLSAFGVANEEKYCCAGCRNYEFWFDTSPGPNPINYAVVNNYSNPNDPPGTAEPLLFRRAGAVPGLGSAPVC